MYKLRGNDTIHFVACSLDDTERNLFRILYCTVHGQLFYMSSPIMFMYVHVYYITVVIYLKENLKNFN